MRDTRERPPCRSELVAEIREHDRRLGISDQLTLFQEMVFELQGIRNVDNHWFGIELNLNAYEIVVLGFDANNWASANEWYAERELENRDNPEVVVALVSTRSLTELRRAYPNFFADIDMFRRLLQETVG